MPPIDLNYRPRLADLRRLDGGNTQLALAPTLKSPRRTPASSLQDRQGYLADFLGEFQVIWPRPTEAILQDTYDIPGSKDHRLDYTHFSVTLSRSRRMALWVGVNIDSG